MKKICFKIARVLIVGMLSLLVLEGLCSGLAWYQYHAFNVVTLNNLDRGIAAAVATNNAAFAETVRPHPYLGIVPNNDARGAGWQSGDLRNFPVVKNPDRFTVLLTGGSTAMLLGAAIDQQTGAPLLQSALDAEQFGKPVDVLNAAEGATMQPRQAIALLLYGDVADAVISLDGFNECTALGMHELYPNKLGSPSTRFADMNPVVSGYDRVGAGWQANKLREFSTAHNSCALFFFTRFCRNRLAATPEAEDGFYKEIWRKPKDWSNEKQIEWNIERYRHFLRMTHAMCGELGVREAHFIQPCPAICKSLTEEERRTAAPLDYADNYRHMETGLLSLAPSVPVASLLDCFDGVTETVYVDSVHNNEVGKRKMAERIARDCAKLWKTPAKGTTGAKQ